MKQHLYFLACELNKMNDDPNLLNMFWHHHDRIQTVIDNVLLSSIQHYDSAQTPPEAFDKLKNIYTFINARPWGDHLWQLHDTHFHTNFKQFIACPFTCVSEIAEVTQKLTEDIYRS